MNKWYQFILVIVMSICVLPTVYTLTALVLHWSFGLSVTGPLTFVFFAAMALGIYLKKNDSSSSW